MRSAYPGGLLLLSLDPIDGLNCENKKQTQNQIRKCANVQMYKNQELKWETCSVHWDEYRLYDEHSASSPGVNDQFSL